MLSSRRPKLKRPDPAVIGEPSPLKRQLDAIAENLRDALAKALPIQLEGSDATKQMDVVTPILETLESTVSALSEDVWVNEISERTGIPPAEARHLVQSEHQYLRDEQRGMPSPGRKLVFALNVRFSAEGKAALEKLAAHERRSQQQIFTMLAEPVLIEAARQIP